MTALLTDEEIRNEAMRHCDNASAVRVDDYMAGAFYAKGLYEARLAEDAKVRAGLVEALVLNVESCGCGMPKPCDYEEIAAVVADDPDNINNYCDSCLSAFAALLAAKELENG